MREGRAAFDADPAVVGRIVRVEGGLALPVEGVIPETAGFPAHIDLWISASDRLLRTLARDGRFFGGIARLRKGVNVSIARAELAGIAGDLAHEYATMNTGWTTVVDPLRESIVGNYRTALLTLMGAVGFVLLISCVNIAGLLLARSVSRRRELAVRYAGMRDPRPPDLLSDHATHV